MRLATLLQEVRELPEHYRYGRVAGVLGMLLELGGVPQSHAVGGRCEVLTKQNRRVARVACEVAGFRNSRALAMPFGTLEGVGLGSKAEVLPAVPAIYRCDAWLIPLRNRLPQAHQRRRAQGRVDLGVRARQLLEGGRA